jgi:hypothetical protein
MSGILGDGRKCFTQTFANFDLFDTLSDSEGTIIRTDGVPSAWLERG